MQAYKIETTLEKDGRITLDHLPFRAGEALEIIILARPSLQREYPLRGTPAEYSAPTEPVADSEWDANQ